MGIKKLAISAAIFCLAQSLAFAAANDNLRNRDLSISNHTAYDLTFSVNGRCTNDFGVARSYAIKVVPKALFQKACRSAYCEVMGFVGRHCSGKSVGGVKYYFDQNAIEIIGGDLGSVSVAGSELNIFYTQKV